MSRVVVYWAEISPVGQVYTEFLEASPVWLHFLAMLPIIGTMAFLHGAQVPAARTSETNRCQEAVSRAMASVAPVIPAGTAPLREPPCRQLVSAPEPPW